MKVNHIAILPAVVRYDRLLSSTAILLWAEISASTDQYGISSEQNDTFGKLLNIDQRTVIRCLNQLVDNGHIIRMEEGNKRKLKVIIKPIPIPENVPLKKVEQVTYDDINQFCMNCLGMWEDKLNTVIEDKAMFLPKFKAFLKVFTEDEILKALKNRIYYVTHSEWHLKPENKQSKDDIMSVIHSERTLLTWTK